MAYFNVLKGAYPSLQQIDKTLPVKSGETGIVRGSCIYADTNNQWVLATSAVDANTAAFIYFALMGQSDKAAGMAGTVGQGVSGGVARVTGIACGQPFEFETDQYNPAVSYAVGDLLRPGDSGYVTTHATGKNVIGQVTKTVASKWVNNAIAVTGWRTGAYSNILTARSLWIPLLTV